MLPALATLAALTARLPGGLTEADEARAQAALDDASAKVRAVARKTWTTDDELDDDIPDVVVTVTLSAARRSFVNPDGVTSESAGSYSVSQAHASPDVYLTAAEERMVRAAAGGTGLGTQPTTRGLMESPTYVDVTGTDQGLPVDMPS